MEMAITMPIPGVFNTATASRNRGQKEKEPVIRGVFMWPENANTAKTAQQSENPPKIRNTPSRPTEGNMAWAATGAMTEPKLNSMCIKLM